MADLPPPCRLERMQYLGVLRLLGEIAVHVPSDHRESIEQALKDAQEAGLISYTQVIHRFDVDLPREAA
jgi:hypothetical protein